MDDKSFVIKLLIDAKEERKSQNRIIYFGNKLVDIPYVGHTLEEGDQEHLIVNLHGLDCVTFVENVVALSLCDKQDKRTFEDFCENLKLIRYRDGILTDYTSRLHYSSWWFENKIKLGLLKEIISEGEPFTAEMTLDLFYMTTHPDYYKQLKNHPNFIPIINKYEKEINGRKYKYIPKENLSYEKKSLLKIIHDGDILAMITNVKGLDYSHLGFAIWKNDELYLLHLSFIKKEDLAAEETLYEYVM